MNFQRGFKKCQEYQLAGNERERESEVSNPRAKPPTFKLSKKLVTRD